MFIKNDKYKIAKEMNILHFDMYNWKYPYNWLPNIRQFFRNLKWAKQRIKYGISEPDIWNLSMHLSGEIYLALHKLADTCHGYPGIGEADTPEKWDAILREMADKFALGEEWENTPLTLEEHQYYDKVFELESKQKCGVFPWDKNFEWDNEENKLEGERLHKEWREATNKIGAQRETYKNEACDLFKKWFYHLWD